MSGVERDPELDRLLRSLLVLGWDSPTLTPGLQEWADRGLGGVILHSRNVRDFPQLKEILASLHQHNPGLLVGVDHEGGRIGHLARAGTPLTPGAAALGVLDDVELTRAVAFELADQLAGLGIDVSYAPVADVQLDPANPIIRTRSFGSDPALVARQVAAWVRGTTAAGVVSCAKHFPGHGSTAVDSHLGDAVDPRAWAEIEKLDLEPFRAAIAAGVPMVMTSHVRFPDLDDLPATVSPTLLQQVLRDQLGFDGVIISDALEMAATAQRWGVPGAAERALAAGVDQLCIAEPDPELHEAVLTQLHEAVAEGRLDRERLQASAGRISRLRRYRTARGAGVSDESQARAVEEGSTPGMAAARRAVRIGERIPRLHEPVLIDLFRPPKAVLEWDGSDLGTMLVERMSGVTALARHEPGLEAEEVLQLAAGRSLILATQDAQIYPWQENLRTLLRTERPDLVEVATGWAESGAHLNTHGRGTANLIAAAELLASRC